MRIYHSVGDRALEAAAMINSKVEILIHTHIYIYI